MRDNWPGFSVVADGGPVPGAWLGVDAFHAFFGIACAKDRQPRQGGAQGAAFGIGQGDLGRLDVFFQIFQAFGAGDRDDVGALVQQPGQCDLRRGGAARLGEGADDVDQGRVAGGVVGGEAGQAGAEIPVLERGAGLEAASQEAPAEVSD